LLIGRDRIEALIPHAGSMCLLEAATQWDEHRIHCVARSHLDPANPLRRDGRLHAVCGVEYAAQAMALHGALGAVVTARPRGGMLASLRDLVLHRTFLDEGGPELAISAERLMGESARVIYAFEVRDGDRLLLAGRAAVVLDA
jgi:predicted hotdog family 3-hydroxylacyl-ACP dehydratase